jgi:hypothetical protein
MIRRKDITCGNCGNNISMVYTDAVPEQWTAEPPTQEGWYWAKPKKDGGLVSPQKDPRKIVVWVNKDATIEVAGYDSWWETENFTHWLGPLPVPEMPKG